MKRTDDDATLRAALAHDDAEISRLEKLLATLVTSHTNAISNLQRAQRIERERLSKELDVVVAHRSRIIGQLVDHRIADIRAAPATEGR